MIALTYACGSQIYAVVSFNLGCIGPEAGEGSILALQGIYQNGVPRMLHEEEGELDLAKVGKSEGVVRLVWP